MNNKDKNKITVIDGAKNKSKNALSDRVLKQTNPLIRKFLNFHQQTAKKFSVKDLFKT